MKTASRQYKTLLAMLAATALVVAGCGAPDNPPVVDPPPPPDGVETTPDTEDAFEGGEEPAPEENPATNEAIDEVSVEVTAFEYGYEFSTDSFPAGLYTFVLENAGAMQHDLVIEGEGFSQSTDVIPAGETTSITVDLAPGVYEVYCSVAGHRAEGMETTITVN